MRPQEVNPAKLAMMFRKELELSAVEPGETLACLSDLSRRRDYIQAVFAAADEIGADIYELCVNALPSWTKGGGATIGKCKGTLEAMKAADIDLPIHVQ